MQKITSIKGTGIAIRGNDIDTDRIIPARFLKEITFEKMGDYSFFDEKFDENGKKKNHPFNDEKFQNASILVVNDNFGCGSSREHAPQSLMRWGIKAIIGEGFADIFAGNCFMVGLVTLTASKKEIENLMEFVEKNSNESIELNLEKKEAYYNATKIKLNINESMRKSFIEGTLDTTSMMLEAKDEIEEVMKMLPYLEF